MGEAPRPARPLLTILVPTRNRISTAVPTVRSLLALPDPEIEVFVQDCSDEPYLGAVLSESFDDPRLRYQYSEPPLSMVANWNLAVPELRGDFVCIIGDDDGVSAEIVAATRWASARGLDAISPLNVPEYFWPDFAGRSDAASVIVRDFTGSQEFPDIEAELIAATRGFGQLTLRLPRPYQGIVRRSLLYALGESTGQYFDGIAPDFYMAYALATVVRQYCLVDFPLVITGRSARSNSGRSKLAGSSEREMIRSHTGEFSQLDWPEMLPSSLNISTVLTQSMLAALRNTGREALFENIDLPLLFASTAAQELPETIRLGRQLARALRSCRRSVLPGVCRFALCLLGRLVQPTVARVKQQIRFTTGKDRRKKGVNDIGEATRLVDAEIARRGKPFAGEAGEPSESAKTRVHS